MGPCRNASDNELVGLDILVNSDGTNAQLNMKGQVTFNSNGFVGMYTGLSSLNSNAKLEINVESGSTLKSCGNAVADISGNVDTSSTLDFSGDGYTCDQNKVVFLGSGAGNVDEPTCQDCT